MKPHEYVKEMGFDSVKQVSELLGKPSNTIVNWHNSQENSRVLELALKGLLAEKQELLRIIAINQHTDINGIDRIAVSFDGGLTLYKDYPREILDNSKESKLKRKIFFNNFCALNHKQSCFNSAQLKRLEDQKLSRFA